MDIIKNKYPFWKRLLHRWQARRDIPFRRKFFVGYDLHGNTYWEFTLDGNMQRMRRKLEPFRQELFEVDYFSTIPPQWLQWLRRTRDAVPTLDELVLDQLRQQRLKILAQQADERWVREKWRLEEEQRVKLQNELDRVRLGDEEFKNKNKKKIEEKGESEVREDPWKAADESKDANPIESASIKPRQ
ncbi:NADH-ubiquinone oxidoreductase assembly factor N7BML [Candida viswanathii]|uniref:NADH-ubiquinone oxidoreductase assembly factor N7BML n=1 Tax=Candida viswanathii TaxID=5486 RepID=A0A367YGS5_9ASCO|nr:NADH-ubiquinone oxidoreductase assembly factor N7BML [Candida viswanathii]